MTAGNVEPVEFEGCAERVEMRRNELIRLGPGADQVGCGAQLPESAAGCCPDRCLAQSRNARCCAPSNGVA